MKINIFWFRRDLRLYDNTALEKAFQSGLPVLPVFIFDTDIIDDLPADDHRISFIYEKLAFLSEKIAVEGGTLLIKKGKPFKIWNELTTDYDIDSLFVNKDYEPYSIERDLLIESTLKKKGIRLLRFKDQVIFEENEILKSDNKPYTVFTPYMKRWKQKFSENAPKSDYDADRPKKYYKINFRFPELKELGFRKSGTEVRDYDLNSISEYHIYRDIPSADRTSYLSPHLRFGTISIRKVVEIASKINQVFLNELIWREFFMQILFHFPQVVTNNFKSTYDEIQWRNNEREFERWCAGETGYPMVDAGMRQLNHTGYMHNRVRMITAGFLCKHLLVDWRWGEAYFARKLFDYELSSNNGNWQWAAGTGCDAAPYFRIFNPDSQVRKFDPEKKYIRKWVDNLEKPSYPDKIINHDFARQRAIETYRSAIKRKIH